MDINEVNQLAKTFTTACKETVEKSKAKTYTVPIALTVMMVLLSVQIISRSNWAYT